MNGVNNNSNRLLELKNTDTHSIYWKKVSIPKGLPSLLETLTREALREYPDDIYSFFATLLQNCVGELMYLLSQHNYLSFANYELDYDIPHL